MIRKTLYLAAAALIIVNLYLVIDYFSYNKKRDQLIQQKGLDTTLELRNQVDAILSRIVKEGEQLAGKIGTGNYSEAEIKDMIRTSSLSIPEIQGVTVCFEPFAFSEKQRLFCPYYNKGAKEYLMVEKSYDYTIKGEGTSWYTGVRDEGAKWVEPYFAKAAKDWYVDYGIPFYFTEGPKKGQVRGTITMSFVASGFKNMIHGLSIGKTGYGMILSERGTFLAHPISEYIGTTNLEKIKKEEKETALIRAYDDMLDGKIGQATYYDVIQKDKTLFFYDKIPASEWGIGLVFYEDDLLNDAKKLKRKYIRLSIFISLLLVCFLAIYYNKDYLDEGEIWRLSIVSTILLIINFSLVGYLQHATTDTIEEDKGPPITDMTTLGNFVSQQFSLADTLKIPNPAVVPTGIYIQRMEFEDSYNLNIGGTIWQKYPEAIAATANIGFTFPQMSPFAEAAYIEESYRQQVSEKEDEPAYLLVGWDFRVTLRLNLRYTDFPFDKRHINIEIQPLNNNDHLLFTPDLSSYSYTNPSQKSGLNTRIQISGSDVLESYFNYSLETYNSDFGYNNKSLFEEVPVLHYNIYLRRKLLNAFVTYLIPIFVTLIMVFIMIFAVGKTEERQGIIESMAAFFFVLIFSHIDLRKEIVTADLIYIEYFYFMAYFMLILSTFNLIIYSKNKSLIFDFNENQLFKAIFFPLFLLISLIVTLLKFY